MKIFQCFNQFICISSETAFSKEQSKLSTSTVYHQHYSQPAITCSKLTIETLEQGVKYVQS